MSQICPSETQTETQTKTDTKERKAQEFPKTKAVPKAILSFKENVEKYQ